jgi:hypothetical protein
MATPITIPLLPCSGGMANALDPSHADYQPKAVTGGGLAPPKYLRTLVDVDLDRDGNLTSRCGFTQALSLSGGLRLFSGAGLLLAQDGGTIVRLIPESSWAKMTLVRGLSTTQQVVFHEHAGQVFWSNGLVQGRITAAGVAANWGCAVCPTPVLHAIAGTLFPGEYQVTANFVDAYGIEHGADVPATITLNGTQALTAGISIIDPAAVLVRFYLSGPDDDRLYLAGDVSISALPVAITALASTTHQCDRIGAVGPEHVTAMVSWRDYLITACESWLYPSVGAAAHLYQPDLMGMEAPEPILSGVGLHEGCCWLIGATDAYWISGESHPKTWKLRSLALRGCTFARGGVAIDSAFVPGLGINAGMPLALFLSNWGLAVGLPDGTMTFPQHGVLLLDVDGRDASIAVRAPSAANHYVAQLLCALS